MTKRREVSIMHITLARHRQLLLGVWLVVSAVVLGFAGAATWITIVLGCSSFCLPLEGFVIPSYLEEWGKLLFGLALLVAPWTVGYESVRLR